MLLRTGLPVKTIFSRGKTFSNPSYATQMTRARWERIRLVSPAKPFCSWMRVGTPASEAANSTGALAYPPVPMTTSGRNRRTMLRARHRLEITLKGTARFDRESERWMPAMGSPTIRYPASGTRVISMRPCAPTNRMSASGCLRRNSSAMDTAGNICPPVPPPLKMIR